jgi:hypothetical protein
MWTVDVDGTDITAYCQEIRWHPRLSRPSSCVVRYPGNLFTATNGVSELHLTNGSLLFSGPVWFQQDDGTEDVTYTELTAYDHLIYFSKRLCKTPAGWPANSWPPIPGTDPAFEPGPCNLADPSKVITDFIHAPEILAEFINATNDCDPGGFPISVGSVASSLTSVEGIPSDWPMDLSTMADFLLGTGQLDIIVNPGYGSSSVDLYAGADAPAGTDRTGSVSIQYGTGSFNAPQANRTSDMEIVTNALWYLLGPKLPQYDLDVTHWAGSITPTAANAGGDGAGGIPGTPWPGSLVAKWTNSRSVYGYMQEIQVHDSREDEDGIRPLFEEMFANEALIRANPRVIVAPSPDRASGSGPAFFVADRISVSAGSQLSGGFSGGFRVYEYEIAIDADGVAAYTELVGSDDQG